MGGSVYSVRFFDCNQTGKKQCLAVGKSYSIVLDDFFAFYPNGGGGNTMRLNFSNAQPDEIREGIARLGRAIVRETAR